MTITLYDLAGADDTIRFSPYCWRAKMSLLHKGLDFDAVPWRFTDKEAIAESGSQRVPVIKDNGKWVADSWAIATYLDETYPDKPLMKSDVVRALNRFVAHWCNTSVNAALRPLALVAVFTVAHDKDKDYFRESREAMLGMTLEDACADRDAALARLETVLTPAEMALGDNDFLSGGDPCYADYALFGSLKWVHGVTGEVPLKAGSKLDAWFAALLDMYDGYARKAPTA